MSGGARPPALLEGLLRLCLPPGAVGDSIIGDLREEYARDVGALGRSRAWLRYLRSVFSVGIRFVGRHGTARHGVDPHRTTGGVMGAFWHDLRHAGRLVVRRPGLTGATVLILGLGIGANTAVFSLVNTILLRPLPYPDASELVEAFRIDRTVTGMDPSADRVSSLWAVPYEVHLDWLSMSHVFAAGGGYAGARVRFQEGDVSESLMGMRMTSGAFRALEIRPVLGRAFLPEDDAVGAPAVAVLSYGFWQARFGGDPGIVGRQIRLDGTAYTVTGVMPPDFAFPSDAYPLWISFTDRQKTSPVRNGGYLKVVARLAPGITLEQARRDMDQVSLRIGELHPAEAEHRVGLFPLKDVVVGDSGGGLLVLLGAVMLVLLLACTNIAGLFLVRATERRREMGVRKALGADRRRLVLQHVYENLILSLLGGAAGWGLAVVGLKPILSLMPGELPRLGEMRVDQSLLYAAIGFAVLTGLLTGILPALRATGASVSTVLREGGPGRTGARARNRLQASLVASQVALAFVLLAGAGLFIRSMAHLLSEDTGFRSDHVALANVSFPADAETMDEALQYARTLEDRLRALPGVEDVGGADQMPFAGGWSAPPATIETTTGPQDVILHMPTVTPSYFTTMRIPLVAGRTMLSSDGPDSEPVVVISRALAEWMAPDGSALGLRVRLNARGDSIWRTVVGVVGDVRYRLNFGPMRMAYIPEAQDRSFIFNWVVRTTADPLALAPAIQRVREELDPEGTSRVVDLTEAIRGSNAVVAARFSVILLGGLAVMAALLAIIGVYGVLAYVVRLRSREIGIQIALGAARWTVLGTVLRRGLVMAGVGLGTGMLLAFGLGRFVESQLFGVEPLDPVSLASAGILLLGAAVLASFIPARRAAALDPMEVLRAE